MSRDPYTTHTYANIASSKVDNVVLYHANCVDGFTAAWVAYKKLKVLDSKTQYCPVSYGREPPWDSCTGKNVFILDFSYPRDILLFLKAHSNYCIVLDHHKTAKEELEDLSFCVFDMTKSGAVLAWEYFFPEKKVPALCKYVQDYDLWKFELENSKEINAVIQTADFKIAEYEMMKEDLESGSQIVMSH